MWKKDVNVRMGDGSAGVRGRNGALREKRAFSPLLPASSRKRVSQFPEGESSRNKLHSLVQDLADESEMKAILWQAGHRDFGALWRPGP